MTLHPSSYESVLHEAASRLRGDSRCPLVLRPICRQLGVRGIRRSRLQDARSVLINASTSPVIILNSRDGRPGDPFTSWERFLIAHEIGHLVLHQLGAKPPSGSSEYWKLETLCDAFARQLLIPDSVVAETANNSRGEAIDQLRATLFIVGRCYVPWSAAALRMSDTYGDAAFFRLTEVANDGFKVVVSTCPNHQGIGQLIRAGSRLCQTLEGSIKTSGTSQEIEAERLSGIGGITNIRSGAACRVRREFRLAVIRA